MRLCHYCSSSFNIFLSLRFQSPWWLWFRMVSVYHNTCVVASVALGLVQGETCSSSQPCNDFKAGFHIYKIKKYINIFNSSQIVWFCTNTRIQLVLMKSFNLILKMLKKIRNSLHRMLLLVSHSNTYL